MRKEPLVHFFEASILLVLCGIRGKELTVSKNRMLVTCRRSLRMMASKTTSAGVAK